MTEKNTHHGALVAAIEATDQTLRVAMSMFWPQGRVIEHLTFQRQLLVSALSGFGKEDMQKEYRDVFGED